MYDKSALMDLVRQKALKFGQFTLASGKKATYYLDGKQVTLDPHGARLVAEGILDLLADAPMPAAIGGMSIGADPITASVVAMSAVRGTPIAGFMVRKEPKGHGTNQYIEGPVQPGAGRDCRGRGDHRRVVVSGDPAGRGLRHEGRPGDRDHRSDGGRGGGVCRARISLRQPPLHPRLRHRAAEVRKDEGGRMKDESRSAVSG